MLTLEDYIKDFRLGDEKAIKEESRASIPKDDSQWDKEMTKILFLLLDHKANEDLIFLVLSPWDPEYNFDALIARLIRDFLLDSLDMEELIIKIQNIADYKNVMKEMMAIRKNKNFALLASMVQMLFERQLRLEEIRDLISYAHNYSILKREDVGDIMDYLKKLEGEKNMAEIPCWMSVEEGENLSLLETVSPGDSYEDLLSDSKNIESQAKQLFYQYKDGELKEEQVSEEFNQALQSFLASLSYQEFEGKYNPNRIFGPANTFLDRNCVSNVNQLGPCRMLHCLCREYNYDEDNDILEMDWFHKRCNFCLRAIRDRSHAIRFPVEDGGWKGCYCSLECMKEDTSYIDDKTNYRIDLMKSTLYDSGIMDRTKV